jgi:hypothetical protein
MAPGTPKNRTPTCHGCFEKFPTKPSGNRARTRSKRQTKEYHFIENLTFDTLDRALPLLFDRLRRAGLASGRFMEPLLKIAQ